MRPSGAEGAVLLPQDGKFHLILVESRIHRLARYYKKSKKLPPNWKYESATASALVQG
jgi:small subunit ribosomal protein S13e